MLLMSDAEDAFAWCLAAVGAGLIAGVEVLCVDDWYSGALERMNTVFKTYVEAWVLLMGWIIGFPVLPAARRPP